MAARTAGWNRLPRTGWGLGGGRWVACVSMGQPITVLEKPSSNPAILRFETNRPLSGMGHEPYNETHSELLVRPVDELARRLFAAGGGERGHINGAVITVTLGGGQTGAGPGDLVRGTSGN